VCPGVSSKDGLVEAALGLEEVLGSSKSQDFQRVRPGNEQQMIKLATSGSSLRTLDTHISRNTSRLFKFKLESVSG